MSDAAEHAFRLHYRDVYRFVRRRSATDVEAEDVTAEVFAAAAAGLDRFGPGASPVLAWLYTVARRRLVDEARRRGRIVPLAAAPPPAYGADVARAIGRALATLSHDDRMLVVRKLVQGRSFRDLSAELGVSEAACKMRLARALERVRDSLAQEGVEP